MSRFTDLIERGRRQHGDKFDTADLNVKFIDAYNQGDRFRVLVRTYPEEKPFWGYVGVTTGWKPCFLMIRRRGQIGSSDTIGPNAVILNSKTIK